MKRKEDYFNNDYDNEKYDNDKWWWQWWLLQWQYTCLNLDKDLRDKYICIIILYNKIACGK